MNALKCRTSWQHSIANDHIYKTTINLIGMILSHLGHFFIGSGFNSTFPLTINNNAIIEAVTSRLHITFNCFKSFTYTFHSLHYLYVFHANFHHYNFTHLQPMIHGQKQPMEDLHCSTEIMVKREIRNPQTRSTS